MPSCIVHKVDEAGGESGVAWQGGGRANAEDYEETESIWPKITARRWEAESISLLAWA